MTYSIKKARILIVDDVPGNIKTLANMLEADYELLAARNGLKAIQTAKSEPVDLILLDIIMPEMDGYEACRQLKSLK